jgi:hypothetical protein
MSARVGNHGGKSVGARPIVNPNPDGRPFVIWAALTAASYRYDVKTFTVVLKYQLLR